VRAVAASIYMFPIDEIIQVDQDSAAGVGDVYKRRRERGLKI
jgi:hypothetical protein